MKKIDLMKLAALSMVATFSAVALGFPAANVDGGPVIDLSQDTLVRNHVLYESASQNEATATEESESSTLQDWEYTLRIRPPKCNSFG